MRILWHFRHWAINMKLLGKDNRFCQPILHSQLINCRTCILTPKFSASNSRFECIWPTTPPTTEWGYNNITGPEFWAQKYPEAGGKKQSPIDIVTSSVKNSDVVTQPLAWSYEKGICKSILNTGCGWRVDLSGAGSELSGGPLTHKYELVQFHCHWGNSSCCGSEHTVDGKAFSGELHFVHWNKDLYGTCAEAVHSPKGLSVIGVFLEVGEKHSEMEKLCKVINQISFKDQRTDAPSDLEPDLFYPATRDYWTYDGSLTTPPCHESVTWIVFKSPISVTEEELDHFRRMSSSCDCEVVDSESFVRKNFRPPQPLNDRHVWGCSC